MNTPPPPIIAEINAVSSRYAGNPEFSLKDIHFTLYQGEIFGIIGANGAGKSTLIKSMLGLLPCEGKITFWGQDFSQTRQKIAYIPQRKDIDWDFPINALDVCLMGMYPRIGWFGRTSKPHRAQALEYLRAVDLEGFAHRPIGALSGGQQQRVFIARALAQQADLIIMDEPFAGVDQRTEESLFGVLKTLKENGKTILIVHHNLQSAAAHFDRIMLLNKSVIALGAPNEIMNTDNLMKTYGQWSA